MVILLVCYITGLIIYTGAVAIFFSWAYMDWGADDEDTRRFAKMFVLAPVYPLVGAYWIVIGLRQAWRITGWTLKNTEEEEE